ncbi:MAG: metallophosphoesterase [Ruminiclostridium sp.]|nr:metallophosphoesterase [Ruminiclostridium sp.]
MIMITGDMHGDLTRFKNPMLKQLKKNDALIVTGDFGCVWNGDEKEKKVLKALGKKKYNLLFVEGVHENFELLSKYPVEEWCGGMTRVISGNLRQLMRGQCYEIAGKKIFTFGGGQSEENNSYLEPDEEQKWIAEIPTEKELATGIENLSKNGNKVDFIISYEPPSKIAEFIEVGSTSRNHINTYLDKIQDSVEFTHWYFGKLHLNKLIPPRYSCVFDSVVIADSTKLPKTK